MYSSIFLLILLKGKLNAIITNIQFQTHQSQLFSVHHFPRTNYLNTHFNSYLHSGSVVVSPHWVVGGFPIVLPVLRFQYSISNLLTSTLATQTQSVPN